MRRVMIGLLMAATAASPALADKGGKGHGAPRQAAHGGGGKASPASHGGGKYATRAPAPRQAAAPHGQRQAFVGRVQRHGGEARAPQRVAHARVSKHAFKAEHRGGPNKSRAVDHRFAKAHGSKQMRQADARSVWQRQARFEAPDRIVRGNDKQARKAWKQALKDDRRFQRAVARQDRARPAERWVSTARIERFRAAPAYRPAVRYAQPAVSAPVFFDYAPAYAPLAYPVQSWSSGYSSYYDAWPSAYDEWGDGYVPLAYDDYPADYGYGYGYDSYADDYWPATYGASYSDYPEYGQGLFGGSGDGLLATLLPILLQSVMGGDLGGLGGLAGYGTDLNVLPLQQASYAPYLSGGDDFSSLLLPSVLNNSFF